MTVHFASTLGAIDAHLSFQSTSQEDAHLPEHAAPLLAETGAAGAIAVQSRRGINESEWLLQLAESHPFILGVVVWLDLSSPDVERILDRLCASSLLKGVWYSPDDTNDSAWLLHGDLQRGLAAVSERNLAFDLAIQPREMRAVPELARRHPELRFVVDHMARPRVTAGEREPWGVLMRAIADCPNVSCKVSGLIAGDVPPVAHAARVQPFVEAVVRLFGFQRLMFGSDWPHAPAAATYRSVVEAGLACVEAASDEQRGWFLRDNAVNSYSLEPPAA